MPHFEIEQYELHVQTFRVEASTDADAVRKLYGGEADAVEDRLEFIEVADDFGLPVDEYRDLADALRALGVAVDDDVISSIRSVQQVE